MNLEDHVGEELCRDANYSLGVLRDTRPNMDHAQFELIDGKTVPRSKHTIRKFLESGGEWTEPSDAYGGDA